MKRILWIGCHKLLVKTELQALRELGYEVYRPTYLSDIYDQSAVTEVDSNPGTLPPEIFQILGETNFFYEPISPKVSKIINDYFDACVVTISPTWLMHLTNAFEGKIIFRTYGQPYLLSVEFETLRLTSKLLNRKDFYYLPHSNKSLESEHEWIKAKAVEVPYWIEDDVFELENSWDDQKVNGKIGLLCPNIANPYYFNHYQYLRKYFKEKYFSIFGVQRKKEDDARVIGTLPRSELLTSMQKLSGFLYTYKEKNTCYLPPIEALIIGVPVLYPEGSLLSKYLGKNGPGEWKDEKSAKKLAKRLQLGDVDLINEIRKSQVKLKDLYRRSACISRFNEVFNEVVESPKEEELLSSKMVVIPFYFPGNIVNFNGDSYSTAEGIPRVVKFFVETLLENGYGVKVLAHEHQVESYWGYFNTGRKTNFCTIHAVGKSNSPSGIYLQIFNFIKKNLNEFPKHISERIRRGLIRIKRNQTLVTDMKKLSLLLKSNDKKILLIPHYYHFRDLANVNTGHPVVLYLPDYVPHLFPKNFKNEIKLYEKNGKKIAKVANLVMTNSQFTADYLPETNLKISKSKIRIFKLPKLGVVTGQNPLQILVGKKFLFYPTQFRPNKRIDLLLQTFDKIAADNPISLVLTGNLDDNNEAKVAHKNMLNQKKVVFVGNVSDKELNWLYFECEGVVISTESEGNFPPQLIEALHFEKPFVAPLIKVVTDELGVETGALLFESNSASSLEGMMRGMLSNIELEQQKVKNLKVQMFSKRAEEARMGFLSVIDESFTLAEKEI
jgi:glycosyltransferase involved in cell wall biosynthesis